MTTKALSCADWVAEAGEVPWSFELDEGGGVDVDGDGDGDGEDVDGDVDGPITGCVGVITVGVGVAVASGSGLGFGLQLDVGVGVAPFVPLGPDDGWRGEPPPFTREPCVVPPEPLAGPDEKTDVAACSNWLNRPDRTTPPTMATRTTAPIAITGRIHA